MTLPLIELPEDPWSRGVSHGQRLRPLIHSNFELQLDNILSSPATRRRGVSSCEDYLAYAQRYAAEAAAYSPMSWREIEGIANGCQLSTTHILALNIHLEMIDLANEMAPDDPHIEPGPEAGCTDFAVQRPGGMGCIIGQTYDLRSFYEEAAFAYVTSFGGVTISGLSFAGVLAANGMNSAGFGVVINKLYGRDSRVGVPHPFILREALLQNTPGRSISMILGAKRACSIHYLCGDEKGLLYPFETTATQWDLLDTDQDRTYAHTNHFIGPRFRDQETRDFRFFGAHTIVRLQRARQLLKELGADKSPESYGLVLNDNHNYPLSICSCDDGAVKFATVAKAIFDIKARRVFFSRGHETLTEYDLPRRAYT